ncbi:MAG: lipase [Gordonia sp.]|uniref:lipase family protein n=1 Tax=Gordonia sp. (in: high G+C Gram-positive bacteria) TaxID=84139 RepID=UPI000C3C6FA3|nr:lipase family protein [Gordonia sp. (in: high G+C Gram-positive bacteria)]MAU83156.1 lipase [Gordonia sp. (in: high G+C Gram-positive bacteria)]
MTTQTARGPANAADLLLPNDDAFYDVPSDLDRMRPGDLIRSRQVELKDYWASHHRSQAWQLLYRSTDLHGGAGVAATTVVLPRKPAPAGRFMLLSFQCAIDAVSSQCFPSYALRKGADSVRTIAPFEFLVVRRALAKGWAVSIPDHEGMVGAWGAPREPGYRTLDGIRAALAFPHHELPADTPVGLWGYSGGGMATSWAAEVAPDYAPELNLIGAVLGSPVGDMASALMRLNGGLHAGLPVMAIAGLRRVYPQLERAIGEHATEKGRRHLDEIARLPVLDAVRQFRHHDIDDYLDIPLADLLAQPDIVEMMDDLQLGTHAPTIPLLVVQAVHDEVIAVDDIDGQVARYREQGATVTYVRDQLSEHYSLLPLSGPMAVGWLADRLEGRPASDRTVSAVAGQRRPRWTMKLTGRGRSVEPTPHNDGEQPAA